MTARPVNDAAAASAALSAFLRSIERRGAVFAHLQSGDEAAGMAALAAAMGQFRAVAGRTAFGDWPRRFWALLLAAPELREPGADVQWPDGFAALARLGRGPRAALLLRLVAHVSEADAAAVLGVSRATYRLAVRRALPRLPDGAADEAAWRQLGEDAQRALRGLSPGKLSELARMREAALQGKGWAPPPSEAPNRERPRWLWPALAAVVAATVAALAATQLVERPAPGPDAGPERIVSEPLSLPPPPATPWDEDLAVLTHPDFEVLLAGVRGTTVPRPGFHAWLVHQLEELPEPGQGSGVQAVADGPVPAAPASQQELPAPLRDMAASLPPAARTQLVARHAQLEALAPSERTALRAAVPRWESLDLATQRARRDDWQAWNRLPAQARARMHQAAAAYAGLPEDRRQALADEFAGLDALERNGWLLGPDLGLEWPQLHPLFALVPAAEQEQLLAVLLSMDATERADLGILAQRTPPGERERLRRELLTTPAGNRPAWLRERASR